MQAKLSGQVDKIGYMMTIESESSDFYGALLVVSTGARPIEFHCTLPIRPKPAQRVLFGETLRSVLLDEQIPKALIEKAKAKPDILLVNNLTLLGARSVLGLPLAMVCTEADTSPDVENASIAESIMHRVELSGSSDEWEVAVHKSFHADHDLAQSAVASISRCVELDEPFERLTIAMEETYKPANNNNAA